MTLDEFKGAMAPLSVNYRRELTKALMTVYWSEFQHVLADEFRDAVMHHIRVSTYFPTVADLRQRLGVGAGAPSFTEGSSIFEALVGPAPAYDPRHGDYWTLEAVQHRFGTQALAAFLAAGGTRGFRDRTDKDIPFLRRDFLRGWDEAGKTLGEARPILPPSTAPRGLAPLREELRQLVEGFQPGDAWEPGTPPDAELGEK